MLSRIGRSAPQGEQPKRRKMMSIQRFFSRICVFIGAGIFVLILGFQPVTGETLGHQSAPKSIDFTKFPDGTPIPRSLSVLTSEPSNFLARPLKKIPIVFVLLSVT
jgi:hypothetical protein